MKNWLIQVFIIIGVIINLTSLFRCFFFFRSQCQVTKTKQPLSKRLSLSSVEDINRSEIQRCSKLVACLSM